MLEWVVLASFTHPNGSHAVLSQTWPISAAEAWASMGSMDSVGPHGSQLHGMCQGKREPEGSHSLVYLLLWGYFTYLVEPQWCRTQTWPWGIYQFHYHPPQKNKKNKNSVSGKEKNLFLSLNIIPPLLKMTIPLLPSPQTSPVRQTDQRKGDIICLLLQSWSSVHWIVVRQAKDQSHTSSFMRWVCSIQFHI